MTFAKNRLVEYKPNEFDFVQRFAAYAHSIDRMEKKDLQIIAANTPFKS